MAWQFWRRWSGKAADASDLTWRMLLGDGGMAKAGATVSLETALKVSTVLACARVLSQGVAQIPLRVLREGVDDSRQPARDHPAYKLLYARPNEWQTSFEFREQLTMHAVLQGNAYAYVGRGGTRSRLVELIPLVPSRVRACQAADYTVTYEVADSTGRTTTLPRDQVLHLKGPSWNGYAGLDAIQTAREAIGLAIATEEVHARLHANGAQPGGVLSVQGRLSKEAMQTLKDDWEKLQGGLANKFRTAVIDGGGATWTSFGMKGVDAQHLETRRNQVEEICRDLGVFPQMIGHSDKTATFASAEAFFLAHVVHSLNPWVSRWEQVFKRDLFWDEDDIVARFSVQGLLRGDNKTRAEFYASGIVNGWLTRNEARRFEDLNPIAGLDDPLVPLNMGTQAERDAAAKQVAGAVKAMLGHNGGPDLDDAELERKIARMIGAAHDTLLAKRAA